jgi:spoIIIJ-associated protein
MTSQEWSGAASTADAAVLKGLAKLGLQRDQVDVHVLGEKTSGLFSLFGFRRVEVKLVVKPGVLRERERETAANEARDRRGRDGRRDRDQRRDRGDRREGSDRRREFVRDEGDRPFREPRGSADRDKGRDRDERRGRDGRRDQAPRRDEQRRDEPRRGDARGDSRGDSRGGHRRPDERRDRRNDGPRPERARPNPRPEERPAADRPPRDVPSAEQVLSRWKALLGWDDLAWTVRNGEDGNVSVFFDAASSDLLSRGGGRTIQSLEHLLNVVRSKGDRGVAKVFLQREGEEPRSEGRKLADVAREAAEEVKRTGRPLRMEPMDARDRKLIHQALADHPDVETSSEGEGSRRKVVVWPKERDDR